MATCDVCCRKDHAKNYGSAATINSRSTNLFFIAKQTDYGTAIDSIIDKIKGGVRFTYQTGGRMVIRRRIRRQIKKESVGHIVVKLIAKPQNVSHLLIEVSEPTRNVRPPVGNLERWIARPKNDKIISFIVPVGPHAPEQSVITGNNDNARLSQNSAAIGASNGGTAADLLNVVDQLMTKVDALEKAVKNDRQHRVETAGITNEILKTVDRLEAGLTKQSVMSMSNAVRTPNANGMSNAVGIPVVRASIAHGSDSGVTSVLAGESTSLYCTADTTGEVKNILWIKPDGSRIAESATRYRIDNNMLYIHHTIITDQGTYRCVVQKEDGTSETADVMLVVSICSDDNPCRNNGKCVDAKSEEEKENVNVDAGATYRRAVVDKYTVTRCVCRIGFYGTLCQHVESTHAALTYFIIFICLLTFICLVGVCCCCCFRNVRNVVHEDSLFAKTFGYVNDGTRGPPSADWIHIPSSTEMTFGGHGQNRNDHEQVGVVDSESHPHPSLTGSHEHAQRVVSTESFTDDHRSLKRLDSEFSNRGSTRSFKDDRQSARTDYSGLSPFGSERTGDIVHSDNASVVSVDRRKSDHFSVMSGGSRSSDQRSKSVGSRPSDHRSVMSDDSHRSTMSFVDDHVSVAAGPSHSTFDHLSENTNQTGASRRSSSRQHGDRTRQPEIVHGMCPPCQPEVQTPKECNRMVCSTCGDKLKELVERNRRGIDFNIPTKGDVCDDQESSPHNERPVGSCTSQSVAPSSSPGNCSKKPSGTCHAHSAAPSKSPSACSEHSSGAVKAGSPAPSRSQSECSQRRSGAAKSSNCAPSRSQSASSKCPSKTVSVQSSCKSLPVEDSVKSFSRGGSDKRNTDRPICPSSRVSSKSVGSKSSQRYSSDRLTSDTEPLYSVRTDDYLPQVDSVPRRSPLPLRQRTNQPCQSPSSWLKNTPCAYDPCRNRCSSALPGPACWDPSLTGRERFRSFWGRELRSPCSRRAFSCGNTRDNFYRTYSPCQYNSGYTQCTTLRCLQPKSYFSPSAIGYRKCIATSPLGLRCRGAMDKSKKMNKKNGSGGRTSKSVSSRSARSGKNGNENKKCGKSSRTSECPWGDKNKNKKVKRGKSRCGVSRNTGAMTRGSPSSACSGSSKGKRPRSSGRSKSSRSKQNSSNFGVTAHSYRSQPCSTGRGTCSVNSCSGPRSRGRSGSTRSICSNIDNSVSDRRNKSRGQSQSAKKKSGRNQSIGTARSSDRSTDRSSAGSSALKSSSGDRKGSKKQKNSKSGDSKMPKNSSRNLGSTVSSKTSATSSPSGRRSRRSSSSKRTKRRRKKNDSCSTCIDRNVDLAACFANLVEEAYMTNFRPGSGCFEPMCIPPKRPCPVECSPRERFAVKRHGGAWGGGHIKNPFQYCPPVSTQKFSSQRMFPVSSYRHPSHRAIGNFQPDINRPPLVQTHQGHSQGHSEPTRSNQLKPVTMVGHHAPHTLVQAPPTLVWSKDAAHHTQNEPSAIRTRHEVPRTLAPAPPILVWSKESVGHRQNTPQVTKSGNEVSHPVTQVHPAPVLVWSKESAADDLSNETSRRQESQRRQTTTTTTTTTHHHHHRGEHHHQLDQSASVQQPVDKPHPSRSVDTPLLVHFGWSGNNVSANANRALKISSGDGAVQSLTSLPKTEVNELFDNRSSQRTTEAVAYRATESAAASNSTQSSRFSANSRLLQQLQLKKQMQQMKQLDSKREMNDLIDETVRSIGQAFSSSKHILD